MTLNKTSFLTWLLLLYVSLVCSAHAQTETVQNDTQTAVERSSTQIQQPKDSPKLPSKISKKSNDRLYKWVDGDGNISYQDSPPPNNVNVINSDVLESGKSKTHRISDLQRVRQATPGFDTNLPVMVYTANNCDPCQSVVLFLTQKKIPFIERDIRIDRNARDRLSKLSKQISVPSLFIGDQIVQGDSTFMITKALTKAGYMKP